MLLSFFSACSRSIFDDIALLSFAFSIKILAILSAVSAILGLFLSFLYHFLRLLIIVYSRYKFSLFGKSIGKIF